MDLIQFIYCCEFPGAENNPKTGHETAIPDKVPVNYKTKMTEMHPYPIKAILVVITNNH